LITFALILSLSSFFKALLASQASEWEVGCCSLGDRILVAFGHAQAQAQVRAVTLGISPNSPGTLDPKTVQATPVPVPRELRWGRDPFLCPVGDFHVLICFGRRRTAVLWDMSQSASHSLYGPLRGLRGRGQRALRFLDTDALGGPETLPLCLPGVACSLRDQILLPETFLSSPQSLRSLQSL